MKEILFCLLLIVGCTELPAQCNKINFVEISMNYAYAKAKKEKKDIFLFIYESGEKKASFFESGIFYKKDICSLFNEKFINIKAKKTSTLGRTIANKHKITAFPCFLILTSGGKLKAKSTTIKGTADLKNFGRKG